VFSKTLKICAPHLSSFSVILLTLFLALLHFGILSFGAGSERYSSVLKASYFQLELTLGRVKARPINDLALTNETIGRIFAAMILTIITILAMNFFIVILNDALAEAENTVNERQLYDHVDECDWKTTNQRK
jgi:polyferredoxin